MENSEIVKLFVGNLPLEVTQEDLNQLFAPFGEVQTCSLLRQYAFITLVGEGAADRAIRQLNGKDFRGRNLVVEESRARPPNSTKVFVGNLSAQCTADDLQELFQTFGRVLDCDKVKARLSSNAGYAFVHMERKEDALQAIEALHGTTFKGRQLSVELSKAQPSINQTTGTGNVGMGGGAMSAGVYGGGMCDGGLLPRPPPSLEHHQSQAAVLAAAAAAAAGLPLQVQQSVHNSFYNTTTFDPTYAALKGLTAAKTTDGSGVSPAVYGALASQVYGSVANQVYQQSTNQDGSSAVSQEAESPADPTALFEAARARFFQQGQQVLAEQQAGRKSNDRDRSPVRRNGPLLPDPTPGTLPSQARPKRRALLPTPPGGPEDPVAAAAADGDPIARCYAEYYQQVQQYQQYQQYQQQYQYLQYAYPPPPPPPPPPPSTQEGYAQGTAAGPESYAAAPSTYNASGAYAAPGNYAASRAYEPTPPHGQPMPHRHDYPYLHTQEPPYR